MRAIALTTISAMLLACAGQSRTELESQSGSGSSAVMPASAAVTPTPTTAAAVPTYPPGRWRLAPLSELQFSLLRLSHILIRHEGVQEGIVSFQLADWTPSPPPPARTVEQARALAEQISERLRKNPGGFAVEARDMSEDVATEALGGVLGVRSAIDYIRTPEVLDAAAALHPGEVSRVVETQYGFHVLQKLPPPEEQSLRGARILIAHDKAPWLRMFLARGQPPSRSPEEAHRFAQSLYERAAKGESFSDLAQRFSEHREALRGGDFGSWSTLEPTPFPREMEVLGNLEIGQISPPLDTPFGIAVLKRLPEEPRPRLGMTTVQQSFNPTASAADPTSRDWVLRNMRALAQEIGKDASKFAQLQKQYCCEREEHWIEGRGEAEAEAMLRMLAPGEVAAEPIELPRALAIIRRVEPRPEGVLKYSMELPAPEKPNLRNVVSTGVMRTLLGGFKSEGMTALGLEPARAQELAARIDALLEAEDGDESERLASFERLQNQVQALLDPVEYERFLEQLNAYTENQLLQSNSSPRRRVLMGMPAPLQ